MVRQGMQPLTVSIRSPDDPPEVAEKPQAKVLYLPPEKALRAEVDQRREQGAVSRSVRQVIPRHRQERDSQRLFEAAWVGPVLREQRIQHVHAHFGGMAARTAWWLRRLYGIRYSFTGHANDIFCENDFPVTNADLVRDAEFVVTETDFARGWMEEKHPFARGKVFRVFNGIDIDGFPGRHRGSAVPRIVSVGRYVEKKGFGDLIEACRLLASEGAPFECLIVGGGPLQEELQARIRTAGMEERVSLLGPKAQHEVRELLATADVFALACVPDAEGGSDNLPTVVMEAMACGVPVVSTRLAGVPEMIEDGVDGRLVEPRQPAALSAALNELLGSPDLAQRLAAAGQRTARARFAVAETTASLKRLLVRRARVQPPPEACALDPAIKRKALFRWFPR